MFIQFKPVPNFSSYTQERHIYVLFHPLNKARLLLEKPTFCKVIFELTVASPPTFQQPVMNWNEE